jgi:hypothetical protein
VTLRTQLRLSPPRLIFDPIDALAWARLADGLPAPDDDSPAAVAARARFEDRLAGKRPRPLAVVTYRIEARVEPAGDVALPAPLELLTVRNASGYDIFFGLVRTDFGVRRSSLPPARYRVNATAPLYQETAIAADLAGEAGATGATRIELAPAYGYPFSAGAAVVPTLLSGALRAPDGGPRIFMDVGDVPLPVSLRAFHGAPPSAVSAPCRLDPGGAAALLIDADSVAFDAAGTATVELLLEPVDGGGSVLTIPDVEIARGRTRAFVQTRLAGAVRRPQGAPVTGARVEASEFEGAARTRADGEFELFLPADLAPGPDLRVDLTVTGPAGETTTLAVPAVSRRTASRVAPIVLPSS